MALGKRCRTSSQENGDTHQNKMNNPSAKDRRYDRQLRLWAADGQRALEETWVVLVNRGPGALGIETLKNLILPGVGRFTILDDHTVEDSDLGINFFVTQDDLGKPRAEVTARLLGELNPEVQGGYSIEVSDVASECNRLSLIGSSSYSHSASLSDLSRRSYATVCSSLPVPCRLLNCAHTTPLLEKTAFRWYRFSLSGSMASLPYLFLTTFQSSTATLRSTLSQIYVSLIRGQSYRSSSRNRHRTSTACRMTIMDTYHIS